MRRGLGLVVVALLIAGCGPGVTPSVNASTATAVPTFIPMSQPFRLFTHCGILTTEFAGRTFYLAELFPARVSLVGSPGNPMVSGTMTLLSRSEEHTSELQSHLNIVCRLLLEKKKTE